MGDKDDSAWVFDSLVGFLEGPIWSAPLMTFIEEKSLIFEPDTLDCKEYRMIYQEYKNVVDLLLGCYMEDMGITPEQFERACNMNKKTKMPIQFQQSLFEQIWAANEYEIFKRMMIQKNLELQLQALSMIEKKYGLSPASLPGEDASSPTEEQLVMEEVLQTEIHATGDKSESELDLDQEVTLNEEHERLATEYKNERALLDEALKTTKELPVVSSTDDQQELSPPEEPVVSISVPVLQPSTHATVSEKQTHEEKKVTPVTPAKEEDIRKRQAYLKAQRDKLVALKKQARTQKLETNKVSRPSTARVAAEATIGGKQQDLPLDPSILQVRRALAARLKAEVVQK